MSKHTPGPWHKGELRGGEIHVRVAGFTVARVDAWVGNGGVSEANARLIAAVPELLEALREASARLKEYAQYFGIQTDAVKALIVRAGAAIAKAEGQ